MQGGEARIPISSPPTCINWNRAMQIPKMLFLLASLITLGMLALMWWQRPDFVLRALVLDALVTPATFAGTWVWTTFPPTGK